MTERTKNKSPVHVQTDISPQMWDAICVLAARDGLEPLAWFKRAVEDCVAAGLGCLQARNNADTGGGDGGRA